ncbi:MAG TPA: PAS domain S-box protein [Thermoanaerobaculia bacterium]|nr:PAS domain S-box protein [Thermoanaerobaculia bacterium]
MSFRLSLRGKFLAFTFGVVTLLVGASLALIHGFVAKQVEARLRDELARTELVFRALMSERGRWLRTQSWVVAEDPRFTATLDLPSADRELQARTVAREARRFQGIVGSDLFVVTDAAGAPLAHLEVAAAQGVPGLSAAALAALREAGALAASWTVGGTTYQVAVAPVPGAKEGGVEALALGLSGGEIVAALAAEASRTAAEVSAALSAGGAPETVAREVQQALGVDLVALLAEGGTATSLVVRRSGTGGGDLRGIAEALEGHDSSILQAWKGRLVQTVTVPIWSQDELVGTLVTGFEIEDGLAARLRDMTSSEVSFAVGRRLVASSWSRQGRSELAARIAAAAPASGRPFQVRVGDETYLTLAGDLGAGARYFIQGSRDEALAFLADLERRLAIVGLGVLLAAGLISVLGSASITRPVAALVAGTRRLASGDRTAPIPATAGGEIGELATSFNDMAEALRASEEALRESESLYRDLFDNARDMVFTTDLELRLVSVNRAGEELTGYGGDELQGRSLYPLLSAPDAARLRRDEEESAPGEPRRARELEVVRSDGSLVTVEVAWRWMSHDGRPVGVHGIARDITERRAREQAAVRFRDQLHQAEKLRALGQMAAGVAHNFNNLLTGILGYSQLIAAHPEAPEAVREDAAKVVETTRRASAVVRRIQTFGRPSDASERRPVDLDAVVRDSVEVTRPKWQTEAQRHGRTIAIELELGSPPPIESSEATWEEILSNLIFNAVDAMPEGGIIRIATCRHGEGVAVTVGDTGSGMDEETRRRAFDPFFTTKGPELGTGLGLSTVWGLVRGEGGRIGVDSVPGGGATFSLWVPTRPQTRPAVPAVASAGEVPALAVLVVDDDVSAREVLSRLLAGHRVATAATAAEALARLPEGYDLVISDWSMTHASGLDLASEVRRRAPATVVALTSGWEVGDSVGQHGAVDLVLQKPVEQEALAELVAAAARLLRQRRAAGSPSNGVEAGAACADPPD